MRRLAAASTAGLLSGGLLRGQKTPATEAPAALATAEPALRFPDLQAINLAGNENPFGPSPAVMIAVTQAVPQSCRYPFREERILREQLAAHEGVPVECILLGNGCDELLAMAGAEWGGPGKTIVATRPTYLQLMHYAEHRGAAIRWVDHTESMHHDLAAMEAAVDASTTGVYVCNPDTPSGTLLPPAKVEAFCRAVAPRAPLFLDEVYLDLHPEFAAHTQVQLVRDGLPVLIGRSFSKLYGLAGHRIGYLVAPPEWVERLSTHRMSSLNFLGVAAARAALGDDRFIAFARRSIEQGRNTYTALLRRLNLRYTPSHGNFVFHETGVPIRSFQERMKARGFLVGRPFPPYDTWCRVSIGTPQEMSAFKAALEAELG